MPSAPESLLILAWPLHTWYNSMRSSDAYRGLLISSLHCLQAGVCGDWFIELSPKNQKPKKQSFEGPGLGGWVLLVVPGVQRPGDDEMALILQGPDED